MATARAAGRRHGVNRGACAAARGMDRRLRIAGIAGALAVSAAILLSPSQGVPLPEPTTTPEGGSGSVAVLATGLDEPRAIAVSGDAVYIAERDGAIRAVEGGSLSERALITLRAAGRHDAGLVGLAAHPDPPAGPALYAYVTYEEGGELWNRVMWIRHGDGRAVDVGTVIDGLPAAEFANGGAMAFGPDGMLYVGTGSAPGSPGEGGPLAGKILRVDPDGSVPPDNPVAGSAVYASGFRDPRGIAWGVDGTMLVADAGPSKNDEITIVSAGAHHGWPDEVCSGGVHVGAAACFDPALGIGGIAVYAGGPLGGAGAVMAASLRAGTIHSVDVSTGEQGTVFGGLGRMRDVAAAPGGSLYAITSNTDSGGFAGGGDDRLVRVDR